VLRELGQETNHPAGVGMTKGDKMMRDWIRSEQRRAQFLRKHCITVTYKGLTMRMTKPSTPEKITEAKAYLKNVIETLHEEAERHLKEVLTTGYSVMEV
jgi:hypothetical protein